MTATDVRLTGRQAEVLELIRQGMTAKEIGARLGITARTVKFHSDILRDKYGVQNVRQLIRVAR